MSVRDPDDLEKRTDALEHSPENALARRLRDAVRGRKLELGMSEPPREHPLANYPASPPRGEDLFYDDGEPMESARHRMQMNLLIDSLFHAWRDRDDFYAGGNMFLYFSETQKKKNDFRGPDVFVVLHTTRRDRKSWVVWEEDGRTLDVVIE